MELFEQGIRQRLSSEQLIGCYFVSGSLRGFKDIRGGEGEPIEVEGMDEIIVSYDDEFLVDGEYYSFNWTVPSGTTKIVVVGEVEPIDKEKFLDTLFNFHLNTRGGMLQLAINSQESTLEEVTGSSHTFLYELLQNANDYPFNKELVRVKFILTEHYLFFFHTGAEFSLRNIAALCTIRQGEKRKNTETIGYKGIGFKTVFVKNEYVFLESGGWHFRFDRAYSESKMFGKCAWTMMPIKTEVNELDDEAREAILQAGKDYRVKFALRHKTDAHENLAQIDKVFSDSQILLFIPNLDSVEVVVPGRPPQLISKDLDNWVVDRFPYKIPEDLKKWVTQNVKDGGKVPPKFIELESIHISFAVPKEGKCIRPLPEARVYNYLPTELNIGLGALINADFIPNGSRNGLHDVEWNNRVMKEVGRTFVSWWASLFEEKRGLEPNSIIELLPSFTLTGQYPRDFKSGFDEAIRIVPCVPTLQEGVYTILPLSETIFDEVGLTVGENAPLSDEEFYALTSVNKKLPHPAIRQNPKLSKFYRDYPDCAKHFDIHQLRSCIQQAGFQKWLQVKTNNIKFLKFLTKRDLLAHVCSGNVFLSASGILCRAAQLYLDIDKYIEDIGFLPDYLIQRLDPEVRSVLSQESNWTHYTGNFKAFNATLFMKDFDWHMIQGMLNIQKNSVGMVHYMAKYVSVYDLPDNYPLFTDSGEILSISDNIYIPSEFGESVREQPWFDSKEMPFVSSDYFVRDKEDVISYLSKSSHGVYPIRPASFYTDFLQHENRMLFIARRLSDLSNSKSFYLFLSKIKDYDIRFTPKMREVYTICCTDGAEEYYLNVGAPIYFQDSSWRSGRTEPWIPSHCCSAISSSYYTGLSSEEKEELEQFFKSKQLVQAFSIADFSRREVIPHLDEICDKIDNKEKSLAFLDFLFTNRKSIFGEANPTSAFYSIPVFCDGSDESTSRSENRNGIYYHGKEIDELLSQPWCSSFGVPVLDSYYDKLFDGAERLSFYQYLGFIKFSLLPFLHRTVFSNVSSLSEMLSDRETNIAFHRYFCDRKSIISENELEHLKDTPIFLSSRTDPKGELDGSATDHYLPSEELTDIIQSDIVPIELLDSIHPDYIKSEEDIEYFGRILKNVSIDTDQFINYICDNEDLVADYIKVEPERNIRFWRWAAAAKSDKKRLLKVFPILGRRFNDVEVQYTYASQLSLSNSYVVGQNFEAIVSRFNKDSLFVSEVYLTKDGDINKWVSLFKAIGITTENKELIFKRIIPNLSELEIMEIVPMISRYTDDIANSLRNGNQDLKESLSRLKLKCEDGIFRNVTDTIITGRFLGIDVVLLPEITIGNFVSEDYLADSDGESVRLVKSFLGLLADVYNVGIDTATELRDYKISFYAQNHGFQRDLASRDVSAHFKLIGELADEWYKDRVGVENKLKEGIYFCIIRKDGEQYLSSDTYLGSAYDPDCDYEGQGVHCMETKYEKYLIHYISEEYLKYSTHVKEFFTHTSFCVLDGFWVELLPLLSQSSFSRYFWTVYAPAHEESLREILISKNLSELNCIPTIAGVKKPSELYDYRIADLKRMVLMLAGQSECTKLPGINLPDWLQDTKIGFKGHLSFSDCIDYLKLNRHDYRRRVYDWLVDMADSIDFSEEEELANYRQSSQWFNGKKEWVPLEGLVALEWGNKTLLNYFSSNEAVCNPSYMPEDRFTYNTLCELLSIPVITNVDFKKTKIGEVDKEAISEIGKRLLYIAYKENPKEWKEQHEKYMAVLNAADICTCTTIEYQYSDSIKAKMKSYCEEDDCLWYVGKWDGPLFARILDWIKRVLKLSSDTAMLENILLDDYNDILHSYEDSLPEELLKLLSEKDKKGIKVSRSESFAEFSDDIDENAHIEHVRHPSSFDNESIEEAVGDGRALNSSISRTSSTSSDDVIGTSYTPSESNTHPSKPVSTRQDATNILSDNDKQEHRQIQNVPKETSRASVADKLNDYWYEKKNSVVRKPHSATSNTSIVDDEEIKTASHESMVPSFGGVTLPSEVSSTPKTSSRSEGEMKRRATEAQNVAERAKDNVDLWTLLSESPEYSFIWFKYLMRLLYGENRKSSTREIQIDFSDCEIVDQYAFTLKMPSKAIPNWIADAEQLTVLPMASNKRKINAQVLLVKEDYVYLTTKDEDLDVDLKAEFTGINRFRLNATGTSLSITDCLETRFIQLDFDDDYNLRDNLPDCIKYIYGPPGTGKTTWLKNDIVNTLSSSSTSQNLLILTPTNKAADVIAEMILDSEMAPFLYRFGTTDRLSLIQSGIVVTRDDDFMMNEGHHIVVTTAARFSYDNINGEDICDLFWDSIIIDEASMLDIVSASFILYKGNTSSFVIAGDPKQIQPVSENSIQPQNIYQMVGLDSFAEARKRDDVISLTVQHRSIPAIGDLVSRFAYNGIVKPEREASDAKPLDIKGLGQIKPINFVGFKTEALDDIYGFDSIGGSALHLYSAIFTYNFAEFVAKEISQKYSGTDYSIGIVCPYKAQADAIKQMLDNRDIDTDNCHVACGTVHSFQGDQCDIMFVVMNPPAECTSGTHINNQNIINVAMSRAKDYLFLLIPDTQISGFSYRELIWSMVDHKDMSLLSCSKLEEIMFGIPDYLARNINVTCHMPVNVYYEPSRLYEVKIDESAIDIQINESLRG